MKGILIDRESGDLMVERGALVTGDPEAQIAEAVVLAMRGEFKEEPLLGGEAARMLGGGVDVMWAGDVKEMLRVCGVEAEHVELREGTVMIE